MSIAAADAVSAGSCLGVAFLEAQLERCRQEDKSPIPHPCVAFAAAEDWNASASMSTWTVAAFAAFGDADDAAAAAAAADAS